MTETEISNYYHIFETRNYFNFVAIKLKWFSYMILNYLLELASFYIYSLQCTHIWILGVFISLPLASTAFPTIASR